jgi:uncharacterized protein (DUF2249 family)
MTEAMPKALAAIPPERVVEVDARPLLQAGQEPFSLIMGAVTKTPPDGALRLQATFCPTPLLHVLGSQGFAHWIEKGEGAHWIVWFYREGAGGSAEASTAGFNVALAALQKEQPELRERLRRDGDRWVLDVRDLGPPEPMELTLAVLDALPAGAVLEQVNQRVPQFLLPLLDARGCSYEVTRNDEREVRLEIIAA